MASFKQPDFIERQEAAAKARKVALEKFRAKAADPALAERLTARAARAAERTDAVAAYQEWLNDEMGARAEDARLLMSNGQKFMDTTSRFLSSGWTNIGMTT